MQILVSKLTAEENMQLLMKQYTKYSVWNVFKTLHSMPLIKLKIHKEFPLTVYIDFTYHMCLCSELRARLDSFDAKLIWCRPSCAVASCFPFDVWAMQRYFIVLSAFMDIFTPRMCPNESGRRLERIEPVNTEQYDGIYQIKKIDLTSCFGTIHFRKSVL